MLKEFVSQASRLEWLPLLAMGIFVAMFLGAIVHVCQRRRQAQFEHMAALPLEGDTGDRRNDNEC